MEKHAASDRVGLLLPYVAVAGSLAVSTVAQVQQGILDYFASWTRSFIIIALVGRQVLTLLENSSLARHLEARVIERTAELRASEQRFHALVQHSSEVVILAAADGRVEYVSESMTRVFGYSEAHLLGQPVTKIPDPDPDPDPGPASAKAWPRSPSGSWKGCASRSCQRAGAPCPGQHGHRPHGQRRRWGRPAAPQRRSGHVPGQGGRPGRL